MANETGLQATQSSKPAQFSFAPTNFNEACQLAERLSQSELVPKNFRGKPQDILVAMQMGAEVNLSIMQSLKSIAVINGMPSLYGDGFLAVIMGHPAFEWIKEDNLEDIAVNKKATCTIKRRGAEAHSVTFTEDMASKAGLLTKDGPWKNYKPRQMQMRARGFCGRDTFADALRGIVLADEAYDIVTVDAVPDPPKIQATIIVPTEKALSTPAEGAQPAQVQENANQTEAKTVEAQVEQSEGDEIITREQAVAYFKAYSASGWLKEESLAFLKTLDPPPESSLVIRRSQYDAAMKWAKTPREKVEPQPDENMDSEPTEEWNGTLPTE
jgi:hypothetical protein